MPDKGVKLVLIRDVRAGGVVRHPGHTLLEAMLPQHTTRAFVERAIRSGAVAVYDCHDADGRPQVMRSAEARAARDRRIAAETAERKAELEAAVKKDEAAKAASPKKPGRKGGGRKKNFAALVDACDIGFPHLPHPERVTAERAHANIANALCPRNFIDIQRGAKEQVDSQG